MATDTVTPIRRGRAPTDDDTQTPLTALTEPLARARATLDLIYCLTVDTTGVALEAVDRETLPWALTSAIEQIGMAVTAAEQLAKSKGRRP